MARLQLSQAMRLSQTLKLTPQLQLAMKMLQLNQIELAELIKEEVEKNPLLEISESSGGDPTRMAAQALESNDPGAKAPPETGPGDGEAPAAGEGDGKDTFDEAYFKYLIDHQDSQYGGKMGGSYHDPEEDSNLEEFVASHISLTDHLLEQLRIRGYPDAESKVIEYLVASLDQAGYLKIDEQQVRDVLGVDEDLLDNCIGKLQTFDPPGIGARNLAECLLLQYEGQKDVDPFVMTVIRKYLEEVAANKIKQIAAAENVELQTVLDAIEEIKNLEPKPGLNYGGANTGEKPRYVKPDVLVTFDESKEAEDERLTVEILSGEVPTIRINKFYESMLRSEKAAPKESDEAKTAKATMSYIREKLQAARFVQDSILRRRETIEKVTRQIFKVQKGFFAHGVKGMRPLVLREVADVCGLHESTVSRVTNSKYVQTPRGLFSLKFFFSSGTTTTSGEDISALHVKKVLKELIDNEDPKSPTSDQKLQELLAQKGIEIARRTVAKYREELNIPSSSKRKKFV